MAWIEKGKSAPLEDQAIPGYFLLDGDILSRQLGQDWTKGQKFPTIVFPSGMQCELWESGSPNNATVHIFGEMDLSFRDTRDEALTYAQYVAEQCGYLVRPAGEQGIEVVGSDDDEHVLITYNAQEGRIADITYIRDDEPTSRPVPELLDQKTREKLPPLYSNENLGPEALAQVKFFMPDGGWTWYGSEYDGEDIFFGLVDGQELELGYFSLTELSKVRGQLGLPVERDRFFEPTSLKDLKAMHEQRRTIQPAPPEEDIGRKERDEAERLTMLKDDILKRFQDLPPEHQATMGLVLVKSIMQGEWGTWLKDALARLYTLSDAFPTVDRADLQRANFTDEEISQLSDADLGTIAQHMRDHYVNDLFADEVRFHTEEALESKRTGKPSEGDTSL